MQDVEVDKQAHGNSTETHIRQKLSFVDRVDRFDGLHFNDDFPLNDQVDSISDFELLTFIYDRQRNLTRDFQTSLSQFMSEASLIGTFEESRAEG